VIRSDFLRRNKSRQKVNRVELGYLLEERDNLLGATGVDNLDEK
jgi:hypothetical protein